MLLGQVVFSQSAPVRFALVRFAPDRADESVRGYGFMSRWFSREKTVDKTRLLPKSRSSRRRIVTHWV